MVNPVVRSSVQITLGLVLSTACSTSERVTGTEERPTFSVATASVSAIDISNGITGGGNFLISSSGLILGRVGTQRVWWQSPSPVFTVIDNGHVEGGNTSGDTGGSGSVLLSTGGGVPFTQVNLQLPAGATANSVTARDLNEARAVIGTAGGQPYGLRWETPYAQPTKLLPPALQYPVTQVHPAGVNNHDQMVGWVVVSVRRNVTRYEAILWRADGTPVALPWAPGATSQTAYSVNDAGVISGSMDSRYPLRWTPNASGGYDISRLNLATSMKNSIDGCGRVVGGSNEGAWVWDSQGVTILPGIGGQGIFGFAHSINSNGEIVGTSKTAGNQGVVRATLWTGFPGCPQL